MPYGSYHGPDKPDKGQKRRWRDELADNRSLLRHLRNCMGIMDTPVGRRKLGIDADETWLQEAREELIRHSHIDVK